MCTRPLFGKILLFSLPLVATGILQLLYNAADIIVVGQFADHTAMAAVGSTGSLVSLVVNLFLGLSVGALSVMSRYIGAEDAEKADRVVHTSIPVGVIGGVVVAIVGFFGARFFLELMATDALVIDQAAIYLQIYFLGMPFAMLYNFGASILRACGDTKRPLIILAAAGLINVGINLWLVIAYGLGVVGVAVGTTVSQIVSAAAVLVVLCRQKGYGKFSFKKMRIHWDALKEIVRIGLPAGIQGTIFSLSNVIIQSSVNSFGDIAMAGSAAAANIEGFVYTAMNSVSQACLTFTAQNYGAKKLGNIRLVLAQCVLIVTAIGVAMGVGAYLLARPLLALYNGNAEVIAWGAERLLYVCVPYFLCGLMEVLVGSLRGMGRSLLPMIFSIVAVCGVRILWIYTVFAAEHSFMTLFISYPVSWIAAILMHLCTYFAVRKKVKKQLSPAEERSAA
ncbi:MAG: MATE family efflux transporter [Bacillota bacterium]|nr:MAG: MATE family efflux transporter [Bacillota bacterium]